MTDLTSQYIRYLPPIFQESDFLDKFLLAFEKIFTQAGPSDEWLALETEARNGRNRRTSTFFH